MVKRRRYVLNILEKKRVQIRQFGVRRIALFGSAARNVARKGSDLDFLVEFEKTTFDSYMDLKFFLEDLFKCRIDLVIQESIKPLLKPYIEKAAIYVPGL